MRYLLAIITFCLVSLIGERTSAQLRPVYFEVITEAPEPGQPTADSWYGAFEVADLSLAVTNTTAVFLTTPFVGGLTNEPGFWFDSGADFVWQGDNNPPGANSTVRSLELVNVVNEGATWQNLFGNSYALLTGVTTDLSALNPTTFRVSGQGGSITFSSSPIPEPSTIGLLALSGAVFGFWVLRRQRR